MIERCTNSGRTVPRLLVVPHLPSRTIRIRATELARALAAHAEVFCLEWEDAQHQDAGALLIRKARQFRAGLASLVARRRIRRGEDGVTYVSTRIWQPILFRYFFGADRALRLARRANTRALARLAAELGAKHILLASVMFDVPEAPGVQVLYDLVDWFEEDRAPAAVIEETRRYLEQVARRARAVFAVSMPLAEKVSREFGVRAIPLPNGADLAALRAAPPEAVRAVRNRWGLAGRYVVGYIGNHGSFTGIDFVLEMFHRVRRRMPDAALFIVGPFDYWKGRIPWPPEPGVVFTGPVEPCEMPAYFNAIDLGLLAQPASAGTEFAFQLKVVEYSACRKFVVSTPLETWKRLAWPNVLLVPLEPDAWAEAVARARASTWDSNWDRLVEPYDWRRLAARVAEQMTAAEQVRE